MLHSFTLKILKIKKEINISIITLNVKKRIVFKSIA